MNNLNSGGGGQHNTAANNGKTGPLDRYTVQPQQKQDDSPFYKSAAPSIGPNKLKTTTAACNRVAVVFLLKYTVSLILQQARHRAEVL